MDLVEFIGFIIAFLAFFFLMIKRALDQRRKRQNPAQYQKEVEEREKALDDFLKSLKGDMEEMKEIVVAEDKRPKKVEMPKPPPPPKSPPTPVHTTSRTVQDNFKFKTKIEDFKQRSAVEERKFQPKIQEELFEDLGANVVSDDMSTQAMEEAYKIQKKEVISNISRHFSHLKQKKDLVIMYEVLAKPKALRSELPWYSWDHERR